MTVDLRRQRRIGESLVYAALFLSAVLSIFITVGIVYELSKEALNFFTRPLWEDTNKTLATDVDATARSFPLSRTGTALHPGQVIRIGDEVMEVVSVTSTMVTCERGYRDTDAAPHAAGASVLVENRASLVEFFTHTRWIPQIGEFGILPLVNATLMTSAVAMVVALPLGLSIAIYLSEYASERMRRILKPTLEVLAGVPTVVYGYFALTFVTPILRQVFGTGTVEVYNTASAGIVIGILIIPLVSSMSEDALSAVPLSLREAAYGLGATRLETAVKVVLPAALSGVAAAFIVAVSRAIGETMVVAIAAGAGPNFTFSPFKSAETMTGHIVRISGGDLSYDSIDYNSIFAIALMLFLITLSLNIISQRVVRRFQEVYE